jgi:hypothetical protein
VIPISGKVSLPFAGNPWNIAPKSTPGVHIPMSDIHGRPKPYVPRVLHICSDNFDALELKKSILKDADYKIVLASDGVAWNMAERQLDRPSARRRKQIIAPQSDCMYALERSRMRDT